MTDLVQEVEELSIRIRQLDQASVPKPTLVYFDIIGICWPIRCLLHIRDVDHEFIPISVMQWAVADAGGRRPLKESLPSGHVPLYVDSDVRMNQSNLIATYLAGKHGMMGQGEADELRVREIMSHAYDALFHFSGMLPVMMAMDIPADVTETRLRAFMGDGRWGVTSNGYRSNLDSFTRYLNANPSDSGFMATAEPSIADLHCFNVLCNWYKAFDRQVFTDEYPELDDYIHRVADVPGVRDYIRNRQEATVWFPLPDICLRLTTPEELRGLIRDT